MPSISVNYASNFTMRDNIFRIASGYSVNVTADSQNGFAEDYDFFSISGTGTLGLWGSTPFPSLSEWYYQLGLEQHGQLGDPQFVQPAGPDGILGFSTVPIGSATIIDDGGAGYSETGSWTTIAGGYGNGSHRATHRLLHRCDGDLHVLRLDGGFVSIKSAASWPAGGNTTTIYTVHSGYQSDRTVTVNQSVASSGSGGWQVLGTFRADAATLSVIINGNTPIVEADGVSLQQVEGDGGLDDDFTVQPTSKTIDAGSPVDAYSLEPSPNGGRANLGSTGGTAQAATSPAQLVQVTSPNGLEKLTAGQQVNVTWRTNGLTGTVAPVQNVIALDSPSAVLPARRIQRNNGRGCFGQWPSVLRISQARPSVSPGQPVGGTDTAAQFNGTNQYVTLPSGFSDFSARSRRLEVWAYPTAADNDARFFDLGNGSYSDNIVLARSGTSSDLTFAILRGQSYGDVRDGIQRDSTQCSGSISQSRWTPRARHDLQERGDRRDGKRTTSQCHHTNQQLPRPQQLGFRMRTIRRQA